MKWQESASHQASSLFIFHDGSHVKNSSQSGVLMWINHDISINIFYFSESVIKHVRVSTTSIFKNDHWISVPGPPSIESVTPGLSSLTVVLGPPTVTNGILTDYKVTYATDAAFSSARHIGQPVSDGVEIVVNSLLADTQYFLKVLY